MPRLRPCLQDYEAWAPAGAQQGYQAFFSWAKQKLKAGLGVVAVVYIAGGREDGYGAPWLRPACLPTRVGSPAC